MNMVSKYTALLGQKKLKESFVKDLELALSRDGLIMKPGKLNFTSYSDCGQKSKVEKFAERWRVYTISWSIKFNGPLYGRTKQSIRLCFGISPLLDVV